jgi:hypothetical protein
VDEFGFPTDNVSQQTFSKETFQNLKNNLKNIPIKKGIAHIKEGFRNDANRIIRHIADANTMGNPVPMLYNTEELLPSLFAHSDNVPKELIKAYNKVKTAPSGKTFIGAQSMSGDSYSRLQNNLMLKAQKEGLGEIQYHGRTNLNGLDFANKAGLHPELVVKEINQQLKEMNKYRSKENQIPWSSFDKNSLIQDVPNLTFKKFSDGGTIMKRTLKYKKGGLIKYAKAGEVLSQGLSFEDPGLASATAGLASSAIELGLDFIPDNKYTDRDGNVIGSVDTRGAAIGKGAARGAAMGAAAGPIGMAIGATLGGGMSLLSRNKEAAELDKTLRLANRNIDTKNIYGKANNSNGFIGTSNTELYPHGGTINKDNPNANAELELNEQFQLPNGVVGEVDAPSHEEGGIEVALPEGTRIYSDRLKMGNKTFAKLAKPINNKIAKLDNKSNSTAKTNTLALFNKQLDNLFTVQESMKQEEQTAKFAKGGLVKYVGGGEMSLLGAAIDKSKQPMIAATGMINSAIQQRNLNKVPRPGYIAPINLSAGASPDMMDFSSERSAIDAEIAASNRGIELGSGSYSTQAANKQKLRTLQLGKRGESLQREKNINTQTSNAYKSAQAQAANQSAQANVGIDQYNLENQMNYNMWKTGNKNAIIASNTKLTTDMFNNDIMYNNQLKQAKILAHKYDKSVGRDVGFTYDQELDPFSSNLNFLKLPPSTIGYKSKYFGKNGGTVKRSLKKTR